MFLLQKITWAKVNGEIIAPISWHGWRDSLREGAWIKIVCNLKLEILVV